MRVKKRDLIEREILAILKEKKRASSKELVDIIVSKYGVDPSYVSKVKSELEKKGLILSTSVGKHKIVEVVEKKTLESVLAVLIPIAAILSAFMIINVSTYNIPNPDVVHAGLGDDVQIVYVSVTPKNVIVGAGLIGFAIGYFVRYFLTGRN